MATRTAIFFDLDDTLVDHQHSMRTALATLADGFAPFAGIDLRQFEEQYSAALVANQKLILSGQLPLSQARLNRTRALFEWAGHTATEEEVVAATEHYMTTYRANERLVPGAAELVRKLKAAGLRLGVITNHTTVEQEAKLLRHELAGLLDVAVISETVKLAKPDPAIFMHALVAVGCSSDRAVMVGDTWDADIIGAHNAGMAAVWLNRYGRPIPDASIATEITALEPVDEIAALLLG